MAQPAMAAAAPAAAPPSTIRVFVKGPQHPSWGMLRIAPDCVGAELAEMASEKLQLGVWAAGIVLRLEGTADKLDERKPLRAVGVLDGSTVIVLTAEQLAREGRDLALKKAREAEADRTPPKAAREPPQVDAAPQSGTSVVDVEAQPHDAGLASWVHGLWTLLHGGGYARVGGKED